MKIVRRRPALPTGPEPRFPMFVFSFPDLDTAIERLRLHGVDLPWSVETNTGGRWVKFQGSPDNLVELVEILR